MRRRWLVALSVLLLLSIAPAPAGQDRFERIAPQAAGFSAERLARLEAFLQEAGSSSMILAHDGKIFFEWGDIHHKHTVHSMRKALLNSLYGIAVGRGVIDLDTTLGELGIDDIDPKLTEAEKQATLSDVLKSRSGVYHAAAATSREMAASRPERGSHQPGEAFYYNNWDFNVLGAIFERQSGETIFQAFLKEVARPLGMLHYKGESAAIEVTEGEEEPEIPDTDGFYQYERDKSRYPAYHFRMSAHDLALYGTLYLNRGKWGERQIVPASWIDKSTEAYSVIFEEMAIGYGMLWYVLMETDTRPGRSFFHTGAGVHMLGVYPDLRIVIVHRVDTEGEYSFTRDRLLEMIDLVFDARVKDRLAHDPG